MRRERSRLLTLGVLIIVALLLLTVGSKSGVLRPVVSLVLVPFRLLAGPLNDGTEAALTVGEQPEDYDTLLERNRELERTVAELQVEIVRLREIERDYDRLSGLLNYTTNNPDQSIITADVIAQDTSSYLRWIMINRGARDGIQVGNPVFSDLGLVGRVEDVAANAAWIRLANDQGSIINARLQNARGEGTVVGQLQGGLRMQFIPQDVVIEVGDLILTSGLGGSFPADIVIGQVTSVRQQPAALFQEAEVRPTVNYEDLDIVSVITSFLPVDPSIFDEALEGAAGEAP